MDAKTFDWRQFLTRWSEEWADAQGSSVDLSPDDLEGQQRRWLGAAPATDTDIARMEARLGCEIPPSYREFLRVSDGWRHAGGFVWMLAGTREAHWHEDASGLGEDHDEFWGDEDNPEETRAQVGLWSRALQLDVQSDATYVLLDPEDVGPDGEWAVRVWASWRASDPERYPSFADFMVAMHQEFHHLEAGRDGERGAAAFVNGTTRAQDAAVDRARIAALRGRYGEAAGLLREAQRYGRPRATELLHQIGQLGGPYGAGRRPPHPSDPRFLTELLPLHAADLLGSHRSVDDLSFADADRFPETARAAADILREMAEGTFRYRPGGAFGEAVDEARELARWGDTDAAWRILRTVVPMWEPLGPDHIAPVGLLADPVLAPVLTAERRLELLATPRGGEQGRLGPRPRPGPGRPVLARTRRRTATGAVVAVRLPHGPGRRGRPGRTARTPRLVARHRALPTAEMLGRQRSPPARSAEFLQLRRQGAAQRRTGGSGLELRIGGVPGQVLQRPVRLSRAGSFRGRRPGDRGVERVEPARPALPCLGRPGRGAAVRVHGAGRSCGGQLRRHPGRTGPGRPGFRPPDMAAHAAAAARALDAIADGYGVTLPRLALTKGRLHSFESVSWTRPPGSGETYLTVTMG